MRGEYFFEELPSPAPLELPPHARRIRRERLHSMLRGGTTSACAENTGVDAPPQLKQGNYLRMRGEYKQHHPVSGFFWELPPHARRIHTVAATATGPRMNYLRMRGEYLIARGSPPDSWELPPHARRIPQALERPPGNLGTTSACAENTHCPLLCLMRWGNYLRMRGEYRHDAVRVFPPVELPPHARRIP